MRTIKFRGYNRKNEKWLYGFYLQNRGQHFVCPDEFATGKSWEDYEIDPETLCQFTGSLDKNGVEIYEGDFLSIGDERWQVGTSPRYELFPINNSTIHGWHMSESEVIGNIHDNPDMV